MWSLASCDLHLRWSSSMLWCSKISANWPLPVVRPLMLGLSLLLFICSVALGLPCQGKWDAIYGPSYKQYFGRKLQETTKITAQNKPLKISKDCQDNLRPQDIQSALMHLNARLKWKFHQFRWHRKWWIECTMSCCWLWSLKFCYWKQISWYESSWF